MRRLGRDKAHRPGTFIGDGPPRQRGSAPIMVGLQRQESRRARDEIPIEGSVSGWFLINSYDMKFEIPDEDVDLIIRALVHSHAFTVAKRAEDGRYRDLAQRLKRKPVERAAEQPGKNAKRRA